MKNLLFIFCFFSVIGVKANPVEPGYIISEIYFPSLGVWEMELNPRYFEHLDDDFEIDSVLIESSYGVSKLIDFMPDSYYYVIANDNLDMPLVINRDNDIIKVHTYLSFGYYYTSSLAIGNHPDSYLHSIKYGQSVARYNEEGPFYKTNDPTIGSVNTLSGTAGEIRGYFYEYNGDLIKNKYFNIDEGYSSNLMWDYFQANEIEIDNNGFYTAKITSRTYSISQRLIVNSDSEAELMYFEPVSFKINENDVKWFDFKRTYPAGITEINIDKLVFSNYPNPARNSTRFIIDQDNLNYENLNITINSINGNEIDRFFIVSGDFNYDCSHLSAGTYIAVLRDSNKVLTTKKIHIIK